MTLNKLVITAVVLVVMSFSGCTTTEYSANIKGVQIPKEYRGSLPKTAKLNVDRIMQRDSYSCATTSLAMVMSYQDQTDITYDKSKVWKESGSFIESVKKSGNDMFGLKKAAEAYGFTNYEFVQGMGVDQLKYLITQDIPVVINMRNYFKRSSHAVVVIGYDEKGFFINDPSNYNKPDGYHVDYGMFKRNWWANMSSPRGKVFRSAFILYKNNG